MKSGFRLILLVVTLFGLAPDVRADFFTFTSRATFPTYDHIDWGDLGAPFTMHPHPFTIASHVFGTAADVFTSNARPVPFERRDQNNGWAGNFAPGAELLWNQNGGSVFVWFKTDVYGGGASIQANYYGEFVARLDAIDQWGNTVHTMTASGVSNGNADGSAVFLGITSDDTPLRAFRFSLDSAEFNPEDFAIDQFDLAKPADTPEPAAIALAGIGVLGLLGWRTLRRAQENEPRTETSHG
jgi:hypothetical protein